ncbi:MAG TPA: hypothetical protein VG713_17985 [Pirellulales bacterium]|nr:hypothetical protein [Pirellulales bacterium]
MSCRNAVRILGVVCVAIGCGRASAEPSGAFDVGDRAQLFIDQVLVRSAHNVSFTLHPGAKHPANPLVRADRPWEGWRVSIYGTVLFDTQEQQFKMWYQGDTSREFPNFATYYATSRDGIVWEKPLVGTATSKVPDEPHNAVLAEAHLASVVQDLDERDPARRYKMVCYIHLAKPEGGPHTYVSPDGLHWSRTSTTPICRSNDVITAWHDRRSDQWIALPKLSTLVRGHVRRCFGLSTSDDFQSWTEPRYIFRPDLRDDAGSLARIEAVRPMLDRADDPALMRTEFYGAGVYQHESCVVAFPWIFTTNNNGRFGNHEGPCEVQLATSRDLDEWQRPFREPVVPLGPAGAWDSGFLVTSSEVVRVGDEIRLYYAGGNYTHGNPCLYRDDDPGRGTQFTSSIGLVSWQLDRFVSADAPPSGAVLETVPVVYRGERLELNAATRGAGSVTVELWALGGEPLARSQPIRGDDVRHRIVWQQPFDVAKCAGKPVRLRFVMADAQLYSFAFRDH